MSDSKHEILANDDRVRIAAIGVSAGLLGGPVIGAGEAVLAILLEPLVAGVAMLTAVDHAADPDRVARFEAGHFGADLGDMADNFVTRHAGVDGAAPFAARGVQVGMADPAMADRDDHVVWP